MLDMARAGARALWSLSESRHNKELMCKSGIVPLMGRLLKSVHIDVVVPTMGTIQQCASQANYQLAITTEGMIFDIVSHLTSDNLDLKRQCSSAIFKCASDKVGGLEWGIFGGRVLIRTSHSFIQTRNRLKDGKRYGARIGRTGTVGRNRARQDGAGQQATVGGGYGRHLEVCGE